MNHSANSVTYTGAATALLRQLGHQEMQSSNKRIGLVANNQQEIEYLVNNTFKLVRTACYLFFP